VKFKVRTSRLKEKKRKLARDYINAVLRTALKMININERSNNKSNNRSNKFFLFLSGADPPPPHDPQFFSPIL
jgi:hypothetical protein